MSKGSLAIRILIINRLDLIYERRYRAFYTNSIELLLVTSYTVSLMK
jgi:hypothetical protein